MVLRIPPRSIHYQWELGLYSEHLLDEVYQKYPFRFGYVVLKRDSFGKAKKIKFSCYVGGSVEKTFSMYFVSICNFWGECALEDLKKYKLKKEENGWLSIELDEEINHKDPYLFLYVDSEKKVLLRDPATKFIDNNVNSIFWDEEDPSCYQQKYPLINTLSRPSIILQTDVFGLIAHWNKYSKNSLDFSLAKDDVFSYIVKCGVLDKIKELGFNTIQFLPLSQTIDGDNWKYRYLSSFPFAIDSRYGTPDSFKEFVDVCHQKGIAILCDIVISHAPYKEFTLKGFKGEQVSLCTWDDVFSSVFLDEKTSWGTKRFNYSDAFIQQYLIESAVYFQKNYGVDGVRIDNVDGILRFGKNGDGELRPHGRTFLRELIKTLNSQKKDFLTHLEAHYFYGDNAKLLVAPISQDERSLGATAYTSSRTTHWFHKEFMPKSAEDITVWALEHIRAEKEWGKSNSTIADFHNHDAAAGLMSMRATGSYAYDALTLKKSYLHNHAIGKIRVMEAFIAFACEGRILDLLQTFLLQEGTFEHDSSICWDLLHDAETKKMIKFKQDINLLLQKEPAFWPENTLYRSFLHIDDVNKVITISRKDKTKKTNKEFIVLIHFASNSICDYKIGVVDHAKYKVVHSSGDVSGDFSNNLYLDLEFESIPSKLFEYFSWEINLEELRPYQVLVLEKQ
jgi:1,4-alpha-glucan branching enzyme